MGDDFPAVDRLDDVPAIDRLNEALWSLSVLEALFTRGNGMEGVELNEDQVNGVRIMLSRAVRILNGVTCDM